VNLQINVAAVGGKTAFVPTWMEYFNKQVNVVLVDWKKLAFFGQVLSLLFIGINSNLSRPARKILPV
jgi:hypothetical protein